MSSHLGYDLYLISICMSRAYFDATTSDCKPASLIKATFTEFIANCNNLLLTLTSELI